MPRPDGILIRHAVATKCFACYDREPMSKTPEKNHRPLVWSIVASFALLVVFVVLQSMKVPGMDLKAQWIWIALLPMLLTLVVRRYIGKFEGAGIKIEVPEPGQVPSIAPQGRADEETTEKEISAKKEGASWTLERAEAYQRTDSLFLVHVYEPSSEPGMKYDVTIFLLRHVPGDAPNQRENFTEVEKVELYLGPSWGDKTFTAPNNGGLIGIRTLAWGSFLAIGRVTFKDRREPLILRRYVDFEMAPKKI
jgi:membrane protein implicated in regulation of membrane protease activity